MNGATASKLSGGAKFAEKFVSLYLEQGFQSLPKKDLDLLVFILLEIDGKTIHHDHSNYEVARKLRVTPARVNALRRDAYARWWPLVKQRKDPLQPILEKVLTAENIEAGAKFAKAKNLGEQGFLAVQIEHAYDRIEFEEALLKTGVIPIYERNPNVVVVHFDTLLRLAESHGYVGKDLKRVRDCLKNLSTANQKVKDLLKKDVAKITWDEIRSAMNDLAAEKLVSAVNAKALLKIAFPFL